MPGIELFNTSTPELIYPAYQERVVAASQGLISDSFEAFTTSCYCFKPVENAKITLLIYVNEVLVCSLKSRINPADMLTRFNVEGVIQNYTQTDEFEYQIPFVASEQNAIHNIHKYSKNTSNLVRVNYDATIEYNFTGGETLTFSANTTSNTKQYHKNWYHFFWNGVSQHIEGEHFDIDTYMCNGAGKKVLTKFFSGIILTDQITEYANNTRYWQKIRMKDYHTVAFFNGKHSFTKSGAETQSNVAHILFTLTNPDGTQATQLVDNTNANGGSSPDETMTANTGLLYAGIGTKNIIDSGSNLLDTAVVGSYYEVQFLEDDLSTAADSLYFEIVADDCKGYETIRLAWVNSLGGWDYFNFNKISTRTKSSKRTNFMQNHGNEIDSVTNAYGYGTWQGGLRTYNNDVTETIEANTDFILEQEGFAIEDLFTSTQVHMQVGDSWHGVVVTEKDYTQQTHANDKLVQYTIEIQKAHNKRVQRL